MEDKGLLRLGVRARRAARGTGDREAAGLRIAALAPALLALARPGGDRPVTVAAYAGVGDEPPTRALLDGLAAGGRRVLLPVVAAGGALDWAGYAGWQELRPGPHGLLEPATEAAPPATLAGVDLALVPALAVDRAGNRLGRGGGYYDRALAPVPVDRRVAVVYADELVAAVAAEPHDEPVGWALTPDGLIRLVPPERVVRPEPDRPGG